MKKFPEFQPSHPLKLEFSPSEGSDTDESSGSNEFDGKDGDVITNNVNEELSSEELSNEELSSEDSSIIYYEEVFKETAQSPTTKGTISDEHSYSDDSYTMPLKSNFPGPAPLKSAVGERLIYRYPPGHNRDAPPTDYNELSNFYRNQLKRELQIIYQSSQHVDNFGLYPLCGAPKDLQDINMTTLENLVQRQPYNEEIFKYIFCTIQSAFIIPPPVSYSARLSVNTAYRDQEIFPGNRIEIEKYVTGVRPAGGGSFGKVHSIAVKNVDFLFAVKTTLDAELISYDPTIHEFFVGLHLNELRSNEINQLQSPNFMYVYGLFKCHDIDPEFEPLHLCPETGSPKRYFIITEFIRGDDLAARLEKISFEDLLSIYCQIVLALHTAWRAHDFTHYDLYARNVMIQDLRAWSLDKQEKTQLIPYFMDGRMIYVRATSLAKIIDYGYSHVKHISSASEEHFGYIPAFHEAEFGIRPLNSTPIHDLLKITGSITAGLLEGKNITVYLKFLPFLFRFPSVSNRIDLENHSQLTVNRLVKDMSRDDWRYSIENAPLEGASIFTGTIDYARDIESKENVYVIYTEAEKDELVATKNGLLREAGVYKCKNNCNDRESLKQVLEYSGAIKRTRI